MGFSQVAVRPQSSVRFVSSPLSSSPIPHGRAQAAEIKGLSNKRQPFGYPPWYLRPTAAISLAMTTDAHDHGLWTHDHRFLGKGHEQSERRATLAAAITV